MKASIQPIGRNIFYVTADCRKKGYGMNVKLKRVNEEIEKIETRISEWQEQLKALKQQRKQLEDQEIIKSIRSMQMSGTDMLTLLDGIQNGNIRFVSDAEGNMHMESDTEIVAESEDFSNEKMD